MLSRVMLATTLAFAAFGAVLLVQHEPVEVVRVESRAAHLASMGAGGAAVHLASESSCIVKEAQGAPAEARMSKAPPPRQDI